MYQKIQSAVRAHLKKHRLVFWYDEDARHRAAFEAVQINGEKIEVQNNEWWLKYHVLREKPETRFLVYAPYRRPADDQNWLLDLNLTEFVFSSDLGQTYREELGLPPHFQPFIDSRLPFFTNARERFDPLVELVDPESEQEETLARKMLGILTADTTQERKSPRAFSAVLFALAVEAQGDDRTKWEAINTFELTPYFWRELAAYLPQNNKELEPAGMVIEVFRRAFELELGEEQTRTRRNCRVLVNEWRDIYDHHGAYSGIARFAEKSLAVADRAKSLPTDRLAGLSLFPVIDSVLANRLAAELADGTGDPDAIRRISRERTTSYWMRGNETGMRSVYEFLARATELEHRVATFTPAPSSADEMWEQYAQHDHEIDALYRRTILAFNEAGKHGTLKPILDRCEGRYVNDYLQRQAEGWDAAGGSLPTERQGAFFDSVVAPYLSRGDKLVVIVSDALRYEAGCELTGRLNGQNRISAAVTPQAAALPTVTRVGMNALLPHRTLSYKADGTVSVDGKGVNGIEGRAKYLAEAVGERFRGKRATARWVGDLIDLPAHEARNQTQDYDLLYLFSNGIDAAADNAKTESQLPIAVEQEIGELVRMVRKIGNQLNRTHIVITADHGFLYQNDPVPESQLIAVNVPDGAAKERRYVAGDAYEAGDHFRAYTCEEIGLVGEVTFSFATGLHRIRKQGPGTRYVHGGISLQELMVPLIRVRIGRSDDVEEVSVQIMKSANAVITAATHPVAFFQVEPVTGKRQPLSLRVRFEASDGTVLSDTAQIVFDSSSDSEQNRGRTVEFHFGPAAVNFNGQQILLVLDRVVGGASVPYSREEYRYQTFGERDF